MARFSPLVCLVLALSTAGARGHEFWIAPHAYLVPPDASIIADIRVGQMFEGAAHPYIPRNVRRFEIAQGESRATVESRIGDRPALDAAPPGAGLNVLLHVTRDYRLVYDDWETFRDFTRHKGYPKLAQAHLDRGLAKEDVTEAYSRYAKSLVAVGGGAGADRRFGLLTEIVALANPYTDDVSRGVAVQVFHDGAPRHDALVTWFAKRAEGPVTTGALRTDAAGIASVPVAPGATYLIDSVVIREAPGDLARNMGAAWESLWASLTFQVPAR